MPKPTNLTAHLGPRESLVSNLGQLSLTGVSGAAWSLTSEQLNLNLVTLAAGDAIDTHLSPEVDVALIVVSGEGSITIDNDTQAICVDSVVLIARHASRRIAAHTAMRFYTVHIRRAGLTIGSPG